MFMAHSVAQNGRLIQDGVKSEQIFKIPQLIQIQKKFGW
jgi:hypothetical protein